MSFISKLGWFGIGLDYYRVDDWLSCIYDCCWTDNMQSWLICSQDWYAVVTNMQLWRICRCDWYAVIMICSRDWYAVRTDMQLWLICSHDGYAVVTDMHSWLICSRDWYAVVTDMQLWLICSQDWYAVQIAIIEPCPSRIQLFIVSRAWYIIQNLWWPDWRVILDRQVQWV